MRGSNHRVLLCRSSKTSAVQPLGKNVMYPRTVGNFNLLERPPRKSHSFDTQINGNQRTFANSESLVIENQRFAVEKICGALRIHNWTYQYHLSSLWEPPYHRTDILFICLFTLNQSKSYWIHQSPMDPDKSFNTIHNLMMTHDFITILNSTCC